MKNIKNNVFLTLQNKWVAITPKNEVVASDDSLKALYEKLMNVKKEDVSIMFVTPANHYLQPFVF